MRGSVALSTKFLGDVCGVALLCGIRCLARAFNPQIFGGLDLGRCPRLG